MIGVLHTLQRIFMSGNTSLATVTNDPYTTQNLSVHTTLIYLDGLHFPVSLFIPVPILSLSKLHKSSELRTENRDYTKRLNYLPVISVLDLLIFPGAWC